MTETAALPRTVKFGEVVRNTNETCADPVSEGLTRIVGLDHLDPGSLALTRWDDLEDLTEGTSFSRVFRSGQVLFAKRRAYQRKVVKSDFDGICSGDLLVFEPSDDRLLADFLPYLVQSDAFFSFVLQTSAGSLSPRTSWSALKQYEFTLPTIEEQQRVVKIMMAVNEVESAFRRISDSALLYSSSFLTSAIEANQDQAVEVPLSAIAELRRERVNPTDTPDRMFVHYSIPSFDELNGPSRDAGIDIQSQKWRIRSESLLISLLNPRIKRVLRVPGGPSNICSSEFAVLECDPNVVSTVFLEALVIDAKFWSRLMRLARGSTKSRERVSPSALMAMRIKLPPLGVQSDVISELRRVQELSSSAEKQIECLEAVRSGLLVGSGRHSSSTAATLHGE